MQHAQHQPVVRQAVIALSSWQIYARTATDAPGNPCASATTDSIPSHDSSDAHDHLRHYNTALKLLRKNLAKSVQDHSLKIEAVLICCVLFLAYDNSRGEHELAMMHLENALSILRAETLKQGVTGQSQHEIPGISRELLYLFYRLDCQRSSFEPDRIPVLGALTSSPLSDGQHESTTDKSTVPTHHEQLAPFNNIAEAQASLDELHMQTIQLATSYHHYTACASKAHTIPTRDSPSAPYHSSLSFLQHQANNLIFLSDHFSGSLSASTTHLEPPPLLTGPTIHPSLPPAIQVSVLLVQHWMCRISILRITDKINSTVTDPNTTHKTATPFSISTREATTVLFRIKQFLATTTASNTAPNRKRSTDSGLLRPLLILEKFAEDEETRSKASDIVRLLGGGNESQIDGVGKIR